MKNDLSAIEAQIETLIRKDLAASLEAFCRKIPESAIAAAIQSVKLGFVAEHISFLHDSTEAEQSAAIAANELERRRCDSWKEIVGYVGDKRFLRDIVLRGTSYQVRAEAFARLGDANLAKEILVTELSNNQSPNLGDAALALITDEQWLADVIFKRKDLDFGSSVVEKISSQPILERLAFQHPNEGIRFKASSQLTAPSALQQLAANSPFWQIRRDCIGKIDDQALLKKIATEDKKDLCRYAALHRIHEKSFFEWLEQNSPDSGMRSMAKHHLSKRFS